MAVTLFGGLPSKSEIPVVLSNIDWICWKKFSYMYKDNILLFLLMLDIWFYCIPFFLQGRMDSSNQISSRKFRNNPRPGLSIQSREIIQEEGMILDFQYLGLGSLDICMDSILQRSDLSLSCTRTKVLCSLFALVLSVTSNTSLIHKAPRQHIFQPGQ